MIQQVIEQVTLRREVNRRKEELKIHLIKTKQRKLLDFYQKQGFLEENYLLS